MEYSKEGIFEDNPSSLVWYRNMEEVPYTFKEDQKFLEITTKYFRLTYLKNKPFYSGKKNKRKN